MRIAWTKLQVLKVEIKKMENYLDMTIIELMGIYNPIFESREDCLIADYNELFCLWLYDVITEEVANG